MEEKKIKLIWEFFGDDALETAKHHAVHLEEYCKKADIEKHGCASEMKESHAEAYLIVDQSNMITVRDTLRPKRGEWFTEE
jgi:hypothetical protein